LSLTQAERDFVRAAQAESGLPSTIKDCIIFARLTGKSPEEVLQTRKDVSTAVNEEYPKL